MAPTLCSADTDRCEHLLPEQKKGYRKWSKDVISAISLTYASFVTTGQNVLSDFMTMILHLSVFYIPGESLMHSKGNGSDLWKSFASIMRV